MAIAGLKPSAILHHVIPSQWFRSKVKKLTFDINHWIKEVRKVKKLRVKKKLIIVKSKNDVRGISWGYCTGPSPNLLYIMPAFKKPSIDEVIDTLRHSSLKL